jgi:hypothetical protein
MQLFMLSPLAAQSFRMELGGENGKMPLDQGNRIRNDVILNESNGQIITNQPVYMSSFPSKTISSPYARLRIGWDFSWAEAFVGAYYDQRKSSYSAAQASTSNLNFTVGTTLFNFSDTQLINHNVVYRMRKDKELEAGLKFQVIEDKFAIAPRIGQRVYDDFFVRTRIGIQSISVLGQTSNYLIYRNSDKKDTDNSMTTKASGNYMGIEFILTPSEKYTLSANFARGTLKGNQVQKAVNPRSYSSSQQMLLIAVTDQYNSYANMDFDKTSLSFEYNFTKTFHLRAGVESETRNISYPGYFMVYENTLIMTALSGQKTQYNISTITQNLEALSDYLIYSRKEKIREQKASLGLVLDFDFKKK